MKKSIIISALVLMFSSALNAQSVINSESLVEDGERIIVSFEVHTDENGIPAKRKEVIMPYVYNSKDTIWLETLEVYGKGRFKRERQENHIAGDVDWGLSENQILKGDTYHYV